MKKLLVLAILAPSLCHAVDFELGAGETSFHEQHMGIWYQGGFPADISLHSQSLSLGLTDYALPWLRWHAGYMFLGSATSEAIAVGSDAAYGKWGPGAVNHGYNAAHWSGAGDNVPAIYRPQGNEYHTSLSVLTGKLNNEKKRMDDRRNPETSQTLADDLDGGNISNRRTSDHGMPNEGDETQTLQNTGVSTENECRPRREIIEGSRDQEQNGEEIPPSNVGWRL